MRILAILTPTDKWGTKTAYTNLRKFLNKRRVSSNSTRSLYAHYYQQKNCPKAF
ncbi:hypothetical protein SAMN04487771_10417 [[Clostridium] aminophilum]|uniref:Uncharacterized protein n=1 Tax=[Clostridium] aminophilum TaxID=1526 RepID=A0A1I0H1R9_9FIRM|nr:hypothetical protein SAMN04487771_10417 [[Clostridium] aminophilum]